MLSEAGFFFWPNSGWDKEIVSSRARADRTLRLLITTTPFALWLIWRASEQAEGDNATDSRGLNTDCLMFK